MNINLRALVFGSAVACALTVTMNVIAAESPAVIRLDTVEVIAHRAAIGVDGNPEVVRLEPVMVTAHKAPTI